VTSCDLDPARLPCRVNTVVVGNLELLPRSGGAGRRVPIEVVRTSGTLGAPPASAASPAAVTALAGEQLRACRQRHRRPRRLSDLGDALARHDRPWRPRE
jgi:hypothetical protein